jgi:hypothetical protein
VDVGVLVNMTIHQTRRTHTTRNEIRIHLLLHVKGKTLTFLRLWAIQYASFLYTWDKICPGTNNINHIKIYKNRR